jgi:hypothetical protein
MKKDLSQKEKSAMQRSMLSSVNQDARNVDGPDQEIQESDPDLQM